MYSFSHFDLQLFDLFYYTAFMVEHPCSRKIAPCLRPGTNCDILSKKDVGGKIFL